MLVIFRLKIKRIIKQRKLPGKNAILKKKSLINLPKEEKTVKMKEK